MQQAGTALAYLGKAKSQLAAAQSASKAYDRAQPVTSASEHEYADLELKQTIEKPYDRVRFTLAAIFCTSNMRSTKRESCMMQYQTAECLLVKETCGHLSKIAHSSKPTLDLC